VALEVSAYAAAEARVTGSGYKYTSAALGPALRALSTSTRLGFAHFGALAGVGKGQRASAAFECFTEFRLWLMIKTISIAHSYANPHLNTSAGNLNSCSRLSVLKVTVVAAAAELLCVAGESADGMMLLNGSDEETPAEICKLKEGASRTWSLAAVKVVSVTDLPDFKRFVKTQESHLKRPLGSTLPPCRGCELTKHCKRTARQKRSRFRRGGW
jgi:hypothetical protein